MQNDNRAYIFSPEMEKEKLAFRPGRVCFGLEFATRQEVRPSHFSSRRRLLPQSKLLTHKFACKAPILIREINRLPCTGRLCGHLLKRSLKSAAIEIVRRRTRISSVSFNRFLLGRLKMGFDPPKPSRVNYPDGTKAACVISLDFDHLTKSLELGSTRWYPKRVEDLLVKNRIGTRDMLEVSEKYGVPMTWAICGQTAEEDPESYKSILRSKQQQEIGVHTYSHVDVASCSEEELEDEVSKCLKILDLPEHPKTFIFPWNREGHFELLAKMGFLTYRDQNRLIGMPRENLGLLNIPPTYYVDTKSYKAQELMKKYLDLCIAWNSVFHLWLHPWSVVLDDSASFVRDTLDPLFAYIKRREREGVLALRTMGDLATFYTREKKQQIGAS